MRWLLAPFLFIASMQAFEYEVIVNNDQLMIARVVVDPHEEIGRHRDEVPHIVIALQGGVITRLEEDGREVDVEFPQGVAIYRPVDPEGEYHRGVNRSDDPIELLMIELKTKG